MSLHDTRNRNNTPAAIAPLSPEAIAQIQSSVTVKSLSEVVFGLIENALDAQATRIEVTVDSRRRGCLIEDNGFGIPPSEFGIAGGLGRMYHTSKHRNITENELHGGTGTFLASLAALSLVSITSRHHEHYSHNTLAIHHSKPITRLTPAPQQYHIRGSAHGTRVVVRDLFGNMPVRVKQRALVGENPAEVDRRWQALRKGVVALLLPWAGAVSIRLSDDQDKSRSFTITDKFGPHGTSVSGENVNNSSAEVPSYDLRRALNILVQAGFSCVEEKDSWVPVSASTPDMSIQGMISLQPAPSKLVQFISFGISPCLGEGGHHDLYDAINHVFSQSNFGQIEDDSEPSSTEIERRQNDRRFKREGPTNKQRKSGGKGIDRWPKFFLRVDVNDVHISSKTSSIHLKKLANVLEALVIKWLEANHFQTRNGGRRPLSEISDQVAISRSNTPSDLDGDQPSPSIKLTGNLEAFSIIRTGAVDIEERQRSKTAPAKARKGPNSTPLSLPFTDWSRIKSSKATHYDKIWKCNSIFNEDKSVLSAAGPSAIHIQPLSDDRVTSTASSRASQQDCPMSEPRCTSNLSLNATQEPSSKSLEETICWENPTTRERFQINARTGMVVPHTQGLPTDHSRLSPQLETVVSGNSTFGRKLRLLPQPRKTTSSAEIRPSPWLEGVCREWKNPVFEHQLEQAIPVTAFDGPGHEVGEPNRHCGNHDMSQAFSQAGQGLTGRLSKLSLPDAQIISQVDRKFILLKLFCEADHSPSEDKDENQLLVLVDQHAASERCILEELFAELCLANTEAPKGKSNLGHESRIQTSWLEKPIKYQISLEETLMFKANAAHFARWGVLYNINEIVHVDARSTDRKLSILTIPPGIVERCRAEPKRLIELLRSEIYTLAETPQSTSQANDENNHQDEPHSWLRHIGSCPQGIIKMLNSRACRSAIMFNDELSILECRELIQKLAKCAFPFICAHGRVSMVPMVYLGSSDENGEAIDKIGFEHKLQPTKEHSFAKAFKQWRGRDGA